MALGVAVPALGQSTPSGEDGRFSDPFYENQPLPDVTESERTDRGVVDIERALRQAEEGVPVVRTPPGGQVVTVIERDRPEYRAPGIKLGGFTLFPQLGAGILAESNVLKKRDPDGDIALLTSANARLESNWSRHALDLAATVSNRTFASLTTEDTTEFDLSSRARADLIRASSLSLNSAYGHFVVDRGAAGEVRRTREPVRFDRAISELTARWPGVRVGGELSLTLQQRDYHDAEDTLGNPVDEDYRDFDQVLLSSRLEFRGKPASTISLEVQRDHRDYRIDTPIDRDQVITIVYLGFSSEITPLIRLRAAAGVLNFNFQDPTYDSQTRPAFDIGIDWTVTPLTTFRLIAKRDVQTSNDAQATAEVRTRFTVGADHELLRNLIVSGDLEHQRSEFALTGGNDIKWREGISARWLVNRNITATLGLSGEQRSYVGRSALNFDDYQIRAGINYAF